MTRLRAVGEVAALAGTTVRALHHNADVAGRRHLSEAMVKRIRSFAKIGGL